MSQEQLNKNAAAIRLMLTANVICEYALLKLVDGTKQNLKMRVKNAISSVRLVQDWFTTHENASQATKEIFRNQFVGDEIVLLSELLETCFGMSEDSLESLIDDIKKNTVVTS